MPCRIHTAFLSAAVLFAAGASAPAFAQESRVVTYGELDLNSEAGAETLIRRIDNAAEGVCGRRDGPQPAHQVEINRACEYETTEVAVNDVNHPNVSAHYYGGSAVIEEDISYYDPRLDPASPQYDPSYVPPEKTG